MKVANESKKAWVVNGVANLFIVLFVYAAVSKLLDFETFRVQLAQSPLLSAYAGIIAWLVPGVEIMIALFLILPRFRNFALYASFFLMVMFTTYIYIILNFSDFIPCSCGGILEDLSWSQHLIFNIVIIALAAMAIILSKHYSIKRKIYLLAGFTILGIGIVAILFVFSEKEIHRNNAFQRRYIPHVLEKIGEYDLKSNSYYISGITDDSIYLGNYGAPLYLKVIGADLKNERNFKVSIPKTDLPYRRVVISVEPPLFYVGDGSVPILFRGNMKDWEAIPISYNEAYFTQYKVADSVVFGFITMSSLTESNALGVLNINKGTEGIKLDTKTLKASENGKFETDGSLLWNAKHQIFIYLYYYKNSYEVFDKNLNLKVSGKTIDTVSIPILDIAHHTKKDEFKLGGKSIIVNRQRSTGGDFLYIHSDRLGQYENDKILNTASIVDVYKVTDYSYAFSFYLLHQREKKLREFQVSNSLLVAIVNDKLWLYKLKPAYFNTGPNATNTAQYQE